MIIIINNKKRKIFYRLSYLKKFFPKKVVNTVLFRYLGSFKYFGMIRKKNLKLNSQFRNKIVRACKLYKRIKEPSDNDEIFELDFDKVRLDIFENQVEKNIRKLLVSGTKSKIFSNVVIERLVSAYINRKLLYGSQVAKHWFLMHSGYYFHPTRGVKGHSQTNYERLSALPLLINKLKIQKRTRKQDLAWSRFLSSGFFVYVTTISE